MRYDINLASRPYIDARRFYTQWVMILVPLFLAAALLTGYAVRGLVASRGVASHVRQMNAQIAKLDEQHDRAEEILNRPENKDIRDKSQFLNGVIARKAFSWTQVFTELERIVPPRVHVLSIKPDIKKDGQVELDMTVAGDSRENAQELLRRMEGSDRFRDPQLKSEDVKQTPGGAAGQVEFEFAAIYVPQPVPVALPATKGGK
jgi:type IV pilus assembly protein PilN